MSGPIKSVIGPAKARLLTYITQARNHLDPAAEPTEMDLRGVQVKINNAIRLLDKKNLDWSDIIASAVDDQTRANLNLEYNNYVGADANFIEVLEQARVMADEIESYLLEYGQLPTGRSRVRLPQLELPSFEGDLASWPQFWSAFSASIDADPSIPDVQKMSYFIGCLKGAAAQELEEINNKSTEELIQQKLPDWMLLEVIKQKDGTVDWNDRCTENLLEIIDKILKKIKSVIPNSRGSRQENAVAGEHQPSFDSRVGSSRRDHRE
jgi:hypothetical protein